MLGLHAFLMKFIKNRYEIARIHPFDLPVHSFDLPVQLIRPKLSHIIRNKFSKRMIILESNVRLLTWLGVYPAEENASLWRKRAYRAFSVMVFASNLFGFLSSASFLMKYGTADLEIGSSPDGWMRKRVIHNCDYATLTIQNYLRYQ